MPTRYARFPLTLLIALQAAPTLQAQVASRHQLRTVAAFESMGLVLLAIAVLLVALVYLSVRRRGGKTPEVPVIEPAAAPPRVQGEPARPAVSSPPAAPRPVAAAASSKAASSSSHPAYPEAPTPYDSGEFRIPVPPPSSPNLDPRALARAANAAHSGSVAAVKPSQPPSGKGPEPPPTPSAKPWYPEPPPTYPVEGDGAQPSSSFASAESSSTHPAYPQSPPEYGSGTFPAQTEPDRSR